MDSLYNLEQQVKLGNVVLFLGAGASLGCKNSFGETMPNGRKLADLIAERFLGKDFLGKDLAYVSELAISEDSLFGVQKYIADIFRDYKPEPYHYLISSFPWKAIFTTNYDLIIEDVYRSTKDNLQELVPVFKNTHREEDIFYKDNVLPYYKIHGCITDINDADAPLILTPDQFINYSSKRENLFKELLELCHTYPILFAGFSMADSDIRTILNQLSPNMSARVRSYMVSPFINKFEERMWDSRKISSIHLTFSDFLIDIDKKIERNIRVLATFRPEVNHPIYTKFFVSLDSLKPSENFISFINNDIDFIHANLTSPTTDPKAFYKGLCENWDPIIRNLDINRKVKDGILFEIFFDETKHESEGQYFYLLKGNAGSGKSVLLRRLAYDGGNSLEKICIYLKAGSIIRPEQIIELFTYCKERIYLFIDNVSLLEPEIIYLLNRCKKEKVKLTVIGAERSNVWNIECKSLSNYLTQSYPVKQLHNSEIEDLIDHLEKYQSLYTLQFKSRQERIDAFQINADRELLVALYEATSGKVFEDIIYDEYLSIADKRAQSLYLTVCMFHRLGAEARAGFISRVHNIAFQDFKESLFEPLDSIVFDRKNNRINDYVYLSRNRLIAEIVFERVLTNAQDRYDEYSRILNNINLDYESDRIAFLSITKAKNLLSSFADPGMIRRIYSLAEEQSRDDAKLFQQRAIFEMNSEGGSIFTAEKLLKEAHRLLPDDPVIAHSNAEMLYKKAEKAKLDSEFFSYVEACMNACAAIIKKNTSNPNSYPYHTQLKANILKLKKVLEYNDLPAIERNIKDIEKLFGIANQLFPKEEFILEIESSYNELFEHLDNAQELLEKAFKANKASPFIALRLANFYDTKKEDPNAALSVLKDALDLNPNDKELNFRYAILLESVGVNSFENIKYYLRRSFTQGDSRFQSQLYYARACYLINEFGDAKDIFNALSKTNIDPEIKNRPVGIIKRNNAESRFEGTITKIEISYGFIKRDFYGDDLFFYKQENDPIWDELKRGQRVSFIIGFTYKGTVALKLKRIK